VNDLKLFRWTGAFGLLCVLCWLSQFPLYMVGSPPSVYNGAAFGAHLLAIKNVAFTRVLLDQGVYVSMLLFTAGFRRAVQRARPECEWLGTLVFGAALVWLAVTLVADGLEGGAVLDAVSGRTDASSVRALVEGTLLMYLGAAAYATFASGVLPKYTGWIAIAGVVLCLVCVPTMYFGPVDYAAFYNPGGFGPAIIANFPPAIWFVTVSVVMLMKRE
jgi:hypothetical protein